MYLGSGIKTLMYSGTCSWLDLLYSLDCHISEAQEIARSNSLHWTKGIRVMALNAVELKKQKSCSKGSKDFPCTEVAELQ